MPQGTVPQICMTSCYHAGTTGRHLHGTFLSGFIFDIHRSEDRPSFNQLCEIMKRIVGVSSLPSVPQKANQPVPVRPEVPSRRHIPKM